MQLMIYHAISKLILRLKAKSTLAGYFIFNDHHQHRVFDKRGLQYRPRRKTFDSTLR